MAKKLDGTAEVQSVESPSETLVEKTETQKGGNVLTAQVKTPSKKVRIHCVESIDCVVAGVRYKFSKGKEVDVPVDVAAILSNSQRAYRM